MNIVIITSSSSLKTTLAKNQTYFIVKDEICLEAKSYVLGEQSVIEFDEKGSFKGIEGSSLNLNGGIVIAKPYPIFNNLEVTGFSNSEVSAEWFNDNGNTDPHIYINKALRCAKGCPVVLLPKKYYLTGTIEFPSASPSTLICPGQLTLSDSATWKDSPVAININTDNVVLDIEQIRHDTADIDNPDYFGTGIKISGQVFHVNININKLMFLKKGIEICPGRPGASGNMEFVNITFMLIYAEYCVYFDIFSNGIPSKNWISRSSLHGGRLRGRNGIYMVDGDIDIDHNHISEILFNNIGFEGFEENKANNLAYPLRPIYLRNTSHLNFELLRMEENLPEIYPWINLKNVAYLNFSINALLNADKIETSGRCENIVIKSQLLKSTDWTISPFDTLIIDSVWTDDPTNNNRKPQKAATCATAPFPMTDIISQSVDLQQAQPTIIEPVEGKFTGLKVLPRMLQFKISKDTNLNLTGLQNYAPCIFFFSVENGATLTLESSKQEYYHPRYIGDMNENTPKTKYKISEDGLYRLIWVTYTEKNSNSETETKLAAYIRKVKNI